MGSQQIRRENLIASFVIPSHCFRKVIWKVPTVDSGENCEHAHVSAMLEHLYYIGQLMSQLDFTDQWDLS